MSKRLLIKNSCAAFGVFIAVSLLFVAFSSGDGNYKPRKTTIQDPAFAVTGFIATQGTNHTVNRGNPLLCRLNRALMRMGVRCVGEARQLTHATAEETSVLWITFKFPDAKNDAGPPGMAALLTDPRGITEPIFPSVTMTDPKSHYDFLSIWNLPAHVTNYAGWVFRIVTFPGGQQKVANFDL